MLICMHLHPRWFGVRTYNDNETCSPNQPKNQRKRHVYQLLHRVILTTLFEFDSLFIVIEPRREKTGLRGF